MLDDAIENALTPGELAGLKRQQAKEADATTALKIGEMVPDKGIYLGRWTPPWKILQATANTTAAPSASNPRRSEAP
jgi:hypothetical protein